MSINLYIDVHVRRAVTRGLRLRDVDVITAQEDGADEFADGELLNRATQILQLDYKPASSRNSK